MLNTAGICCRRRVMFEKLKIRNLKRARGVFFVNLTKKKEKKEAPDCRPGNLHKK